MHPISLSVNFHCSHYSMFGMVCGLLQQTSFFILTWSPIDHNAQNFEVTVFFTSLFPILNFLLCYICSSWDNSLGSCLYCQALTSVHKCMNYKLSILVWHINSFPVLFAGGNIAQSCEFRWFCTGNVLVPNIWFQLPTVRPQNIICSVFPARYVKMFPVNFWY